MTVIVLFSASPSNAKLTAGEMKSSPTEMEGRTTGANRFGAVCIQLSLMYRPKVLADVPKSLRRRVVASVLFFDAQI